MIHEKIIKDQRGTVRIQIQLVTFSYGGTDVAGNKFRYDVQTSVKAPKKKIEVWNKDIATPEEIQTAKIELWELLNPITVQP